MNTDAIPQASGGAAAEPTVPELVAQVYESAPAQERGQLLEQLLRPLGLLSLLAIAGGVFASIRMRSGWQELHVRLEDIGKVRASDIVALADHAQQVSVETVDGLAQMLLASPVLSGSTAAGLLVAMLLRRAHARQGVTVASTPSHDA